MEINKSAPLDFYNRVQLENVDKTKPEAGHLNRTQGARPPQTDTVSLSDEAQLRTEAYRTAMNTSDVRADKVADLKARVENGTYEIDSLKIAQGILRDEAIF